MKRFIKNSCLAVGLTAAILFLVSCAVLSKNPLALKNEIHEDLLIGDWQLTTKKEDIYTIRDIGDYYIAEHKKDKSFFKFALVKLGNKYFINMFPVKANENHLIWMIHVDQENLILYAPDKEGMADLEKMQQNKELKISTAQLRKWCADHINNFSKEVFRYKRISEQHSYKKVTPQEKYTRFKNDFWACQKIQFPEKLTQQNAINTGRELENMVNQMYSIISRYELPADIQNAALNYTRSVSDFARTLQAAPYIPVSNEDAILYGFFSGLAGDPTGGAGAVSNWQNALSQKVRYLQRKEEDLKIILIKYGVKY